jgi:hypothetical protein
MSPRSPATAANPLSVSAVELARLLSAAGGKQVTAEMIQRDVDMGAPTNANGTINLIHYTAWLLREAQNNGT